MTALIGQILGCLLVAAAIGGAVGWLLRNLSSDRLKQQYLELNTALRSKEQALETALYDAKVKASAAQILESKVLSAEALVRSTQQELTNRNSRLNAIQAEWSADKLRLASLEAAEEAVQQRTRAFDEVAAAQAETLRQSETARRDAEQAIETLTQEGQRLQQRIAELEHRLAETNTLRRRVEELEPFQGRVHWLEVQLSDRETEHRALHHQLESQLAERDRQIAELEPLRHQLEERDEALRRGETAHAKTLAQQEIAHTQIREQHTLIETLNSQLTRSAQALHEKEEQICGLHERILQLESQQANLAGQAKKAEEKEEEIGRLRKRLVEVRAALRIRTNGGTVATRPARSSNGQLSLQIDPAKSAKERQQDDLKKIHGIGPVFARTLHKMGLHTFIQIARWKPDDIAKVAKKLDTAPDRIKRDNWIASAKKQHREKYGERI